MSETDSPKKRVKFIQPSQELLQHLADNQKNPSETTAAEQIEASSDTTAVRPAQRSFDVRSIYPEPKEPGQVRDEPVAKAQSDEEFSFHNGFMIGGGIFGFRLLSIILLAFMLKIIAVGLQSISASGGLVVAVATSCYAGSILVIFYCIPYLRLKAHDIARPQSLAMFGVAIEVLVYSVVVVLFMLVVALVLRLTSTHLSLTASNIVSNLRLGVCIAAIVSLIWAWLLTKLAWGITFWLYGKLKHKVLADVVGWVMAGAIIVSSVSYLIFTNELVQQVQRSVGS